ncbi:hypothetical protein, partial [Amycolatopsis japonica]
MEPDRSEYERRLVEKAQRALVAISLGEDAEALDELMPTAAEPQARSDETKELVMMLFGECSAMVSTLGDGGSAPVKVQVFDEDGEEVSIDQADPPVGGGGRPRRGGVRGTPEAAPAHGGIELAKPPPDDC